MNPKFSFLFTKEFKSKYSVERLSMLKYYSSLIQRNF